MEFVLFEFCLFFQVFGVLNLKFDLEKKNFYFHFPEILGKISLNFEDLLLIHNFFSFLFLRKNTKNNNFMLFIT